MNDEHIAEFVGSLLLQLCLDERDRLFAALHLVDDLQFPLAVKREDGLDVEHRPHGGAHARDPAAPFEVIEVVCDDKVLQMQAQPVDVVVRLLRRLTLVAAAERHHDERPLSRRRRKRIDDEHVELGIVLSDVRRRLCGDLLGGRKPRGDGEMHDVLRALLGERQEVLVVRLVIEHGRARKAARTQFVVKIDVLPVLREVIEPAVHPAVLFHRERERDKLDVILRDKVMVEIARRIGRQCKEVFHNHRSNIL